MKALKGIFIYSCLVILAALMICALGVGFLYLSPKSTLFGYYFRHVSLDSENHYTSADISSEENITLKINSNKYGVRINSFSTEGKKGAENKISIISTSEYFGFLKADVDAETGEKTARTLPKAIINSDKLSEDKKTRIIEISMVEPEGKLVFQKSNTIEINLPYSNGSSFINYSLDITGGDKDITFNNDVVTRAVEIVKNGDKETEVENPEPAEDDEKHTAWSEKLKAGLIKYKDKGVPLNIVSLNLTTNKGNAVISGIGSEIGNYADNWNVNELNISTNGGTFDFSKFKKVTVSNKKLFLTSKNAKYKFNKLVAVKGMEVVGSNVKFDAEEVHSGEGGFLFKSDTGALHINVLNSSNRSRSVTKIDDTKSLYKYTSNGNDKIYENTIFTESAAVELGEVVGKLGLYNKYGNVIIGHLAHQASMTSENGDVKITTSGYWPTNITENDVLVKEFTKTSSIIVYTKFGDINVGEYYQDGVFSSQKGAIVVNSKKGESSVKEDTEDATNSRYYYTQINSKDGKITLSTEINPFRIVCTGDANVKVNVNKVLDTVNYPSETENGYLPKTIFEELVPYYVSTKNGKIEAKLPIQSYLVKVGCKKITGEIGATYDFSNQGGTQIGVKTENAQSILSFAGKSIIFAANV